MQMIELKKYATGAARAFTCGGGQFYFLSGDGSFLYIYSLDGDFIKKKSLKRPYRTIYHDGDRLYGCTHEDGGVIYTLDGGFNERSAVYLDSYLCRFGQIASFCVQGGDFIISSLFELVRYSVYGQRLDLFTKFENGSCAAICGCENGFAAVLSDGSSRRVCLLNKNARPISEKFLPKNLYPFGIWANDRIYAACERNNIYNCAVDITEYI